MITLQQVNNEFYLNGKHGDYWNFNFDGKYKQLSYSVKVFDNKIVRTWIFRGKLENE